MADSKKNEGRISLALPPILARSIRQMAFLAGCSLNDFVCKILENVVQQHEQTLKDFDDAESKAKIEIKKFVEG